MEPPLILQIAPPRHSVKSKQVCKISWIELVQSAENMLVTQTVSLNRMAIGPRLIFQVALHEDRIKKNAEIETENAVSQST
jgi:hypothetical protein